VYRSAQGDPGEDRSIPPYGISHATVASTVTTPRSSNQVTAHDYASPGATQFATFTADDMALLHHWTYVASLTITDSERANVLWQDITPRIAFEHNFLLYAILSSSALHLAHTNPSCTEQRLVDAARHHNTALQGFRHHINNMTEDVSDAIMACSYLNVLYVFGAFGRLGDLQVDAARSSARKSQILGADLIAMNHGVAAVLGPLYPHILQGPLAPLVGIGNWDSINPDELNLRGDEHFRHLRTVWAQDSSVQVYDDTLHALRRSFVFVGQSDDHLQHASETCYNGKWASPGIWIHVAPREYFELLSQRQPAALLIYCYFGVVLHGLNHYWFMDSWGRNVVEVVDEILGTYWSPYTQWPRRVVGLV